MEFKCDEFKYKYTKNRNIWKAIARSDTCNGWWSRGVLSRAVPRVFWFMVFVMVTWNASLTVIGNVSESWRFMQIAGRCAQSRAHTAHSVYFDYMISGNTHTTTLKSYITYICTFGTSRHYALGVSEMWVIAWWDRITHACMHNWMRFREW